MTLLSVCSINDCVLFLEIQTHHNYVKVVWYTLHYTPNAMTSLDTLAMNDCQLSDCNILYSMGFDNCDMRSHDGYTDCILKLPLLGPNKIFFYALEDSDSY